MEFVNTPTLYQTQYGEIKITVEKNAATLYNIMIKHKDKVVMKAAASSMSEAKAETSEFIKQLLGGNKLKKEIEKEKEKGKAEETDFFKSVPVAVPKTVKEQIEMLKSARAENDSNSLAIAVNLYDIRENNKFLQTGQASFKDFVEKTLGFSYGYMSQLVKSVETYRTFKLPPQKMNKLNWSQFLKFSRLLDSSVITIDDFSDRFLPMLEKGTESEKSAAQIDDIIKEVKKDIPDAEKKDSCVKHWKGADASLVKTYTEMLATRPDNKENTPEQIILKALKNETGNVIGQVGSDFLSLGNMYALTCAILPPGLELIPVVTDNKVLQDIINKLEEMLPKDKSKWLAEHMNLMRLLDTLLTKAPVIGVEKNSKKTPSVYIGPISHMDMNTYTAVKELTVGEDCFPPTSHSCFTMPTLPGDDAPKKEDSLLEKIEKAAEDSEKEKGKKAAAPKKEVAKKPEPKAEVAKAAPKKEPAPKKEAPKKEPEKKTPAPKKELPKEEVKEASAVKKPAKKEVIKAEVHKEPAPAKPAKEVPVADSFLDGSDLDAVPAETIPSPVELYKMKADCTALAKKIVNDLKLLPYSAVIEETKVIKDKHAVSKEENYEKTSPEARVNLKKYFDELWAYLQKQLKK